MLTKPTRWAKSAMSRLDSLTPPRIAGLMVIVALVGGGLYIIGWAQAWMPNVVVGALTVALTVINRAIRREGERRVQPHVDDVLKAISSDFQFLLAFVVFDYAECPGTSFQEIPAEPQAILDLWMSVQIGNKAKHKADWYPGLVHTGDSFAGKLEEHRRRDYDAIPVEVIRAIDRFQGELRLANTEVGVWLEGQRKHPRIAQEGEMRVVRAAAEWLNVFAVYAPEPVKLRESDRNIAERVGERDSDSESSADQVG